MLTRENGEHEYDRCRTDSRRTSNNIINYVQYTVYNAIARAILKNGRGIIYRTLYGTKDSTRIFSTFSARPSPTEGYVIRICIIMKMSASKSAEVEYNLILC